MTTWTPDKAWNTAVKGQGEIKGYLPGEKRQSWRRQNEMVGACV